MFLRLLFRIIFAFDSSLLVDDGLISIEVDGSGSSEYVSRLVALMEEYELSELFGEQGIKSQIPPEYYRIENPDGFHTVEGVAKFLRPDRTIGGVRFWTVASSDVWSVFVDHLTKIRGPNPKVTGSEFDKVISVPGEQTVVLGPGTVGKSRLSELRIQYADGLITVGSPTDFEGVNFDEIRKKCEPARGKHQYYYLQPSGADKEYREAILLSLMGLTSPQLQQFDGEDIETYDRRRKGIESKLSIVKALFDGVDELAAWTELPDRESGSFKFHARLQARDGSTLQQWIAQLRPEFTLSSPGTNDSAAVSVAINVALPDVIADWAMQECMQLQSDQWRQSAIQVVEGRKLAATAEMIVGEAGSVRIEGHADRLPMEVMTTIVGVGRDNGEEATFPLNPPKTILGIQLDSASITRKDTELHFVMEPQPVSRQEQLNGQMGSALGLRELARLRIDAASDPKFQPDATINRFWREVETLGASWVTRGSTNSPFLEQVTAYRSFTPKLTLPGDWTAEFVLESDDNTIAVNGRVGNALHRMLVARKIALQRVLLHGPKGH